MRSEGRFHSEGEQRKHYRQPLSSQPHPFPYSSSLLSPSLSSPAALAPSVLACWKPSGAWNRYANGSRRSSSCRNGAPSLSGGRARQCVLVAGTSRMGPRRRECIGLAPCTRSRRRFRRFVGHALASTCAWHSEFITLVAFRHWVLTNPQTID